jgi:hypothetical protein
MTYGERNLAIEISPADRLRQRGYRNETCLRRLNPEYESAQADIVLVAAISIAGLLCFKGLTIEDWFQSTSPNLVKTQPHLPHK